MKWILLSVLVIFPNLIFSQAKRAIDGYKYALVNPLIYEDGIRDKFGFEQSAKDGLTEMGISVLPSEDRESWPSDAFLNPCLVLYIEIGVKTNPNAITCGSIYFNARNCKNEIVLTKVEPARVAWCNPPYDCCVPKLAEACHRAFTEIKYNYNPSINTLTKNYPIVEQVAINEDSIKHYLNTGSSAPIEGIYRSINQGKYSSYTLAIIKSNDEFKAIILNTENPIWKRGEVKGKIQLTAVHNEFIINWFMSNKEQYETIGSLQDAGLFSIQMKDKNNAVYQSKFLKIYPIPGEQRKDPEIKTISTGTGFLISNDGLLATNAHVIEGGNSITVLINSHQIPATKILSDKVNDVAILKLPDSVLDEIGPIPYSFRKSAQIGESIYTIGYPLNYIMGNNFKASNGIISANSGVADDVRYYQITAPIQPGNSGGPLFDQSGNVIGITSARLNEGAAGSKTENVNYAVKIDYLINLLNMLPNYKSTSGNPQIKSKTLPDQISTFRKFIFLIESK